MHRVRSRLTYANVMATLALFIALATGGAYAANTIYSEDIVDGEVKRQDIGYQAVTQGRIADGTISTAKYKSRSVTAPVIAPSAVTSTRLAPDAVTGDRVLDGSLSAADIAVSSLNIPTVLWAVVGQDSDTGAWTVLRGRGATWVDVSPPGRFVVHFDRDVSSCAYVATARGHRGENANIWSTPASDAGDAVPIATSNALIDSPDLIAFNLAVLC